MCEKESLFLRQRVICFSSSRAISSLFSLAFRRKDRKNNSSTRRHKIIEVQAFIPVAHLSPPFSLISLFHYHGLESGKTSPISRIGGSSRARSPSPPPSDSLSDHNGGQIPKRRDRAQQQLHAGAPAADAAQ